MLDTFRNWTSTDEAQTTKDLVLFWLAWLLHLPLLLFLGYAVVNGDWKSAAVNTAFIAVAFIPRWMEAHSKYNFPALAELALSVALVVEAAGRTFNLYEQSPVPYDLFSHFFIILSFAMFGLLLLYALFAQYEVDYDGWFMIFAGALIGLGVAGAWEIVEWLLDTYFQTNLQHGLHGTMTDLVAGAVGALVGAFLTSWYHDDLSRERLAGKSMIFYEYL